LLVRVPLGGIKMTEATNRSEKALRSLIKSYVADSEQPLAFSWVDSLVRQNDALVAALTLIAYRYESGDIGDLINDMPEIEAALEAAK
jgi:hypothetical protein